MSSRAFKLRVWQYPGNVGWHFVTLPRDASKEIKDTFGKKGRAWGSLRVNVTVGKTSWSTSIFPDRKVGAYLLPIKADVRRAENIVHGDAITITITLL